MRRTDFKMYRVEKMKTVRIYTDGSCPRNPGPGGWAYVIVDHNNKVLKQVALSADDTTNNRMELTAIIMALNDECIREYDTIVIVSDSEYCVRGAEQWIHWWEGNGWRNAKGDPVKNQDLWKEILEIRRQHHDDHRLVLFQWTPGHSGNEFNELADKLAGQFQQGAV